MIKIIITIKINFTIKLIHTRLCLTHATDIISWLEQDSVYFSIRPSEGIVFFFLGGSMHHLFTYFIL